MWYHVVTLGVLDVKNSGDWAVEKWSFRNKKDYAARHGTSLFWRLLNGLGYELVVKDMSSKRKYTNEWRESWEKIDTIKEVMHQYPHHEWFWWMDLVSLADDVVWHFVVYVYHGTISFPRYSNLLRLDKIVYRNISNSLNPLDIPEIAHVDSSKPVDILISQDCGGFNLGSFLVRRSEFSRRLLDMWWDPVLYEQKWLFPHKLVLTEGIWSGTTKNRTH